MNEFRHRESSSLLDNERIQTSRVVVIAWQWTNSDIESRRHCLTINEFKHRKSSSLLTLLQILEYVFVQSSHESNSKIRALSILLSRRFKKIYVRWSRSRHVIMCFLDLLQLLNYNNTMKNWLFTTIRNYRYCWLIIFQLYISCLTMICQFFIYENQQDRRLLANFFWLYCYVNAIVKS